MKQVDFNGKSVAAAVIGVTLLIVAIGAFTIIGPTDRGILHTLGKPSQEVLTPGLQFKLPLVQRIKKWTVVPKLYRVNVGIGDDGAITKDNQVIGATIRLQYAYDEARLYEAATKFDRSTIERGIEALSVASLKAVIGNYTIFDVAVNQDTIVRQVGSRIKDNIGQYPIIISQITLENFDWSDNFDKQIQETMAAAQKVKRAEQEANIAEQENKKKKIVAEATAQAAIAEAEGRYKAAELDAKAEIERARGKSEANRMLQQNLAVEIKIRELDIEKLRAERWDGRQIPTYLPLNPAGGVVTLPSK